MRFVSTRTHGMIDYVAGLVIAASPWLFGFSAFVWLPHLILGAMEIMASLITRTVPDEAPSMTGRA